LQRRNFEERQAVMNSSWLSIVLIAGLLAAGNAFAQAPLPRQHAVGSVSYVTGGIGSEEAQAMRDASADYPLTLELAAASGGPRDEYISNADVRILDGQGSVVLDTRTQGPFLLVRLPAGTYAVDVEWSGVRRQKTIEIGERRQHLLVEFPGSAEVR
jgi:hypothetical protein